MASVATVAGQGNRRETLVALRDFLAAALDGCASGRDIAAISRQFTEVLSLIEEIDQQTGAGRKATRIDEVSAKRVARMSGAGKARQTAV